MDRILPLVVAVLQLVPPLTPLSLQFGNSAPLLVPSFLLLVHFVIPFTLSFLPLEHSVFPVALPFLLVTFYFILLGGLWVILTILRMIL